MSAEIEDNSEIIRAKRRRLQALHLQAARYGINTAPEVSIEIEDLEKEIRQLQQAASAPVQPPAQSQPTQGRGLTFGQKIELVDNLLACASISNRGNRDAILRQMRPEISNRVFDDSRANIHVLNIVDTCLNFPGGLAEFIAVLRAFEGNSTQMQELDATLSRILPGFPNS
jgi:hypothetical protein